MARQSKSTLEGYFIAGAVPVASNFEDLIDSCHSGHVANTIISDDTDTSPDAEVAAGGVIYLKGGGAGGDEQKIKLPEASSGNIGLTYKFILGNNATNLRVGPDGTTTKLTGSLSIIPTNGAVAGVVTASMVQPAQVGATHVSLSSADNNRGGVSGSVIEFFYNSATGVTVFGTVLNSGGPLTGSGLFGTGDIG